MAAMATGPMQVTPSVALRSRAAAEQIRGGPAPRISSPSSLLHPKVNPFRSGKLYSGDATGLGSIIHTLHLMWLLFLSSPWSSQSVMVGLRSSDFCRHKRRRGRSRNGSGFGTCIASPASCQHPLLSSWQVLPGHSGQSRQFSHSGHKVFGHRQCRQLALPSFSVLAVASAGAWRARTRQTRQANKVLSGALLTCAISRERGTRVCFRC